MFNAAVYTLGVCVWVCVCVCMCACVCVWMLCTLIKYYGVDDKRMVLNGSFCSSFDYMYLQDEICEDMHTHQTSRMRFLRRYIIIITFIVSSCNALAIVYSTYLM